MDLAQIEEDFGANISKLVRGVIEMDNIRQLNITHSASSLQVDNVRRNPLQFGLNPPVDRGQ